MDQNLRSLAEKGGRLAAFFFTGVGLAELFASMVTGVLRDFENAVVNCEVKRFWEGESSWWLQNLRSDWRNFHGFVL